MDTTLLAIGTRKGLWLATSEDRRTWSLSQPHFLMTEVAGVGIDTRGGRTRLLVGVRSEHFGPTVVHSDDLGETWTEPEGGAIRFPADTGAAVERIWQLRPDSADRPGVVWAGCEPISVWRSDGGGGPFAPFRRARGPPPPPGPGAGGRGSPGPSGQSRPR